MGTCTNNCAAVTPTAGTGFIFRGGDTWTGENFGIVWAWGGSSGSPIYIGVDLSWYSGSVWTRPIWTCGGTNCGGTTASYYIGFPTNKAYNIVDNIEVTGLFETSAVHPNYFNGCGTYHIFERIYAHGWSTNLTSGPSSQIFGLACGAPNQGVTLRYNVGDGSDSSQNIMYMTHSNTPIAYGNEMSYLQTGLDGCGDDWDNNIFENQVPQVGGGHADGMYQQTQCYSANTLIYNNIVRGSNFSGAGGTVKLWFNGNGPCPFPACNNYGFNNVVYNNLPGNMIDTGGHFAVNYGNWFLFNNTFDCGNDSSTGGCEIGDNGNTETTSTTTLTIGTGTQTLTLSNPTTFGLAVGVTTAIYNGSNKMTGTVSSFSSPTLVMNITSVTGSGTFSSWSIGGNMGLTAFNNHWISSAGGPSQFSCTHSFVCNTGTTNDLVQPLATANAQGYNDTGAFAFQPTNSSGGTVGAGINESSICSALFTATGDAFAEASCNQETTYAITYNQTTHSISYPALSPTTARPATGTWDDGAYQFLPCTSHCSTVTWTNLHQVMDGFGGQTWTYANSLTSPQADLFFSPSAGIGMEYVRTMNTADSSIPDTVTLEAALARGALIELGLQSPPCSIKHTAIDLGQPCASAGPQPTGWTNGTAGTSGTCLLNALTSSTWTTWANYVVSYVNTMASTVGGRISVVDVQNEPDQNGGIGGCLMTAAGFDTFVGTYLGPAFAAASWNSTQKTSPLIMLPSSSNWFGTDFISTCLNDAGCKQYVSIVSGHGYGYPHSPAGVPSAVTSWQAASSSNHLWLSETGAQSGCDTGMTGGAANGGNGLIWAQNIHNMLTVANVSGLEWWELAYAAASCNFGLTTDTFATTSRLYVEGNWSKFISPGWIRIDTTVNPQAGVYVTAFKNPANTSFTIVAINTNTSATSQNFSLSAFPTIVGGTVTPWVTSASLNLVAQSAIPVSGSGFPYSLPLSSVTTFVGSTSATAPAVSLSPTSYSFGTVTIGGTPTEVFTLTNTGTATLNVSLSTSGSSVFTIASTTCGATLAASASCNITVKFSPTAATSYSATVNEVDTTNGVSGSASVTGTGQSATAPAISWTPSGYNFGNITVSTTAFETFTLKNTGTATLNVSLSNTGTTFTRSSTTCGATLAASATCTVTVQFLPTSATAFSGTLVETDTPNSITGSASLSGTGVPTPLPAVSWSPTAYNFGPVPNGTTATAAFNLTNSGAATLNVNISLSGTPFYQVTPVLNPCGATLAAGASCNVNVQFIPLSTGAYSGSLVETDTVNGVSGSLPLSGQGVPGVANLIKLLL